MQNSQPPRSGNTLPEQQQEESDDGLVPRTPSEHDASADSQGDARPGGDGIGKAAHDDAASDRQDTDKGAMMNDVYNNQVRDGSPKEGPRT